MNGTTNIFESLFDINGSIKPHNRFYCDITKCEYRIVSTKLHFNTSWFVIGAEHRLKRLKDDEIRLFQENELRKRFKKVKIIR